MPFIRGVFDFCRTCGAELDVRRDVMMVERFGNGLRYHTRCGACRHPGETIVSTKTHNASIDYLKQVATDQEARDMIIEPVSSEELTLMEFAGLLEATDDVVEAISGHKN